jgi:hypothetical protein
MFGDQRKVKPGEAFSLGFDLGSVSGLKAIELISRGVVLARRSFRDFPQRQHVDFPLTATRPSWYAVTVEDRQGRKAYSDPIWIDTVAGLAPDNSGRPGAYSSTGHRRPGSP